MEFNPFAPVSAETAAAPAPAPPVRASVPVQAVPAEEEFEQPVVYGTAPVAAADPRVVQAMAASAREGRAHYSGEHELPDNAFGSVQSPGASVPVPRVEPESDEAKMTPIQREMAKQSRKLPIPVSTVGQSRRPGVLPNPVDPTKPIYVAGAGNGPEVVEQRAQQVRTAPPVINPKVENMSRNPRFSRPTSR